MIYKLYNYNQKYFSGPPVTSTPLVEPLSPYAMMESPSPIDTVSYCLIYKELFLTQIYYNLSVGASMILIGKT
jgi:hypothetical protein